MVGKYIDAESPSKNISNQIKSEKKQMVGKYIDAESPKAIEISSDTPEDQSMQY
jgi:hypothetical protein